MFLWNIKCPQTKVGLKCQCQGYNIHNSGKSEEDLTQGIHICFLGEDSLIHHFSNYVQALLQRVLDNKWSASKDLGS